MGPFVLLLTQLLNNIDNAAAVQPRGGKESKFDGKRRADDGRVVARKTANSANPAAGRPKPLNLDRAPRRL